MEVCDMKGTNSLTTRMICGAIIGSSLLVLGGCLDGGNDNTAGVNGGKFRGFNEEVLAVADAGDGKLYVGGYFSAFNNQSAQGLARVNRDGSLDNGFVTGKGFDKTVHTIATALDGRDYLYVGGDFSRYGKNQANNIIRLKSDGSRDEAFAVGSGFDSQVDVIAPARDGSGDIYVGGRFSSYNGKEANRLVRLNSDGSVDESFRTGSGANGIVHAIVPAIDGSGDVYVAGEFTAYDGISLKYIARLNPDGSPDVAFNPGSGFDREVFALALANDNSRDIYAGGWFNSYDGKAAAYLVRLTETGELNSRFESRSFSGEGAQYVSSLVTVDNCSGAIYVGGNFSAYAGEAVNGLMRLDGKGRLDRRFDVDVAKDGTMVNSMVSNINGDLYVGGWITRFNGEQPNYILRLHEDGSRDLAFGQGQSRRVLGSATQSGGYLVEDSRSEAL